MRPSRIAAALCLAIPAGLLVAALASQRLSPVSDTAPTVIFDVEPGATLGSVAKGLEREGLVRSARALEWLGRWRGVAEELRSGEYELSASLSSPEILERLVRGRVRTVQVVIPEGFTTAEIATRLEEAGLVEAAPFVAMARDPAAAAALGVEGRSLEGYLFPETYQLARGLPPRRIVEALVGEFHAVWAGLAPRARERGLGMHEVVTLASIVEKETGAPDERPLIASVFLNRLARGMRLESDPTTIYGIPDFDGNLRRVHLEDVSNPYNTYQVPALPPGPIANPGRHSLAAVVEPAETQYLYFVSRNDGTHEFSETYAAHLGAVDRYQSRRR